MSLKSFWGLGGGGGYFSKLKQVFGSDLISHFLFDETSGTVNIDSLAGYNGVYSSVTLNQTGYKTGKSIKFVTPKSYVRNDNILPYFNANHDEFAIMFWFKKNAVAEWEDTNFECFFRCNKFSAGTENQFYLIKWSDRTIYFFHKFGGTSKTIRVANLMGQDGWNHFCVTGSKASNVINGYINGQPFNTNAVTGLGTFDSANPFDRFSLGIEDWTLTTGSQLKGYMDHLSVINRLVTPSEIQQLLNYDQIIFDGDSRTANYSTQCALPYLSTVGLENVSVRNVAVAGNTISQRITSLPTSIQPHYRPGKKNWVVLFCGVNGYAETPEALYNQIQTYCNTVKGYGYKVLLNTEIAAGDAPRLANNWPTKYIQYNDLLLANHSFADGLVHLGGDARLQNYDDTTYFDSSKVHLELAGTKVIGSLNNAFLLANY